MLTVFVGVANPTPLISGISYATSIPDAFSYTICAPLGNEPVTGTKSNNSVVISSSVNVVSTSLNVYVIIGR